MTKRGRKPKSNRYFAEEQEKAVVDFIKSENETEKNRIFNSVLRPAFTKMVESIIRRYNLYIPDEEFQQTFDDTMSFLMTKLSCFKPETNYKAYSYCGTICKNYLIYKITKYTKNLMRNESYDNPMTKLGHTISDNISFSYDDVDQKKAFIDELTSTTVSNIQRILDKKDENNLSDNEEKVGKCLVQILTQWNDIFAYGSNKYNKSSVLMQIKQNTQLNTKDIREAMRVYKKCYKTVKEKLME